MTEATTEATEVTTEVTEATTEATGIIVSDVVRVRCEQGETCCPPWVGIVTAAPVGGVNVRVRRPESTYGTLVLRTLAERLPDAEALPVLRQVYDADVERLNQVQTELRDAASNARSGQYAAEQALADLRTTVGRTAIRYAIEHDWCSVVQRALEEMGIDPIYPQRRVTVTLEFLTRDDADDESTSTPDQEDIARMLYGMSQSTLEDAIQDYSSEDAEGE